MPRKSRYTDEQLITAVKDAHAIIHVLRALGIREAGGNYLTIHNKIKELGIDTSHWTGKGWRRGRKFPGERCPDVRVKLIENSHTVNTMHLKHRLLREGIFAHRCMRCMLTEWLGQPIPLELHHVNGERTDHRLENLQLLCPNCHALTDTYRARNKRKGEATV